MTRCAFSKFFLFLWTSCCLLTASLYGDSVPAYKLNGGPVGDAVRAGIGALRSGDLVKAEESFWPPVFLWPWGLVSRG